MNNVRTLGGFMLCFTVLFTTVALAEIAGKEPGTSSNPKDNVPKEIQRSALGESKYPGGTGAGTRSDDLVGMKKEKPDPMTEQELKKNVEKTQGGEAAIAAEELHEKGKSESPKK